MKAGAKGALLASAVAMMFLASSVRAQEGTMAPSGGAAKAASTKCVGGNDCKGQSSCKTASNDCKGKNGCKGKGFVMTSSADDCKTKGGHVEGM